MPCWGFVDNYVDFAEMTKEQRDEVYNRLVLQTDNSLSEKDRGTQRYVNGELPRRGVR